MACDAIQPKIRPFLDDLLDESDYHGIHAHLEICESCRTYASSVGTLSYRLYELGQVPLPPDMVSAVLYESQKLGVEAPRDHAVSAPNIERNLFSKIHFFWIGVAALLALSVALVIGMAMQQRIRKDSPEEISVVPALFTPPVLSGTDNEWHYHLSLSSRPELLELIGRASFEIKSESPNAIVFSVPKAGWGEFKNQMSGLHGVVKEFGELDASPVSGDAAQVSVYLE